MRTAVLVDYAGVLTGPVSDAISAWMAADELDAEKCAAFFRQLIVRSHSEVDGPMHGLEVGTWTGEQFEVAIAAELLEGGVGVVQAEGLLQRMFGGIRPDLEMIEVVARARAAGVRTALVSNSYGLEYPREHWPRMFDVTVISAEVGMRKPDPKIYQLALDGLRVRAEDAVFVDDFPENIAAAEALGIAGVLHVDAASTAARLDELLGVRVSM